MHIELRDFTTDRHVVEHKHQVRAAVLLVLTLLAFSGFVYSAFLTQVLDPALELPLQAFFRDDYYYCFLLPLTLLPTYTFFYLNYMSKTYFEHN